MGAPVTAGADGATLDRDLPQRVLVEWLAKQDIPWLDLLPALRAVEPLADGRRHVDQLRDTHCNARQRGRGPGAGRVPATVVGVIAPLRA